MLLKTLETMGPLHGYGIARRIEQMSDDALKLNEGTVYATLMRLLQRRWISASWGRLGEQSEGQVLHHHQVRSPSAHEGNQELGPYRGSHGAFSAPRSGPEMWARFVAL